MQTIINKALEFIDSNVDNGATVEQLHIKYNISPANISIDHSAKKDLGRREGKRTPSLQQLHHNV